MKTNKTGTIQDLYPAVNNSIFGNMRDVTRLAISLHVVDALIEKKGLSDNDVANRRVSYGETLSLKGILKHVNNDVNLYESEGTKRRYSVDVDAAGKDEYDGGIRHSIDTMAESLN